ncbi:hypothetical protein [Candidatus Tisiphia endosymbiont of Metellina segmentata]|uniref:hypothetical protein n=1 Tax=Candidatus Tisiphia endosymbiont of Metellina segmentata TaxID=3066274 RepID=UPI00313B1D45
MSKDRTLLVRLSTAKQLLENKIYKTERAIKLFATDSSVYEILKAANLEECCNFVKTTEDRSSASQELKASLKGLHSQQSVLSKYNTVNCKKFEERSDQIHTIIQARKLLKCIDQHDFKEALKIAGLSYIIKKGALGITRIWITENTFFENLDKYLEVKREEYKIILEAHQAECGASTPALPLSTLLEGSSNCNNTYVTNNNHPAVASAPPSVLPLNQHLYPQLSPNITTTAHTVHYPPKVRKHAPPPPIPPPYSEAVHDVSRSESDENNLEFSGIVYHHD